MWHHLGRLLLAGWFVGMIVIALLNSGTSAQAEGTGQLHFPLIHANGELHLHDYLALMQYCPGQVCSGSEIDYFTVRADGSEGQTLVLDTRAESAEWSPDGNHFVYGKQDAASSIISMWLMPLATREPQLLLESEFIFLPKWSPDGERFALVGSTSLHIYEMQTGTLTEYPLPEISPDPRPYWIAWSQDSQRLAWAANWGFEGQTWVWNGDGESPQPVYRGLVRTDPAPFFWSPDGTRLLINTVGIDASHLVYESNPAGEPATVLMIDFDVMGWLQGDTYLLLRRDSRLYLALGNGTAASLYFEAGYPNRVSVSPDENWVAIGTFDGLFLRPALAATYTHVEGCNKPVWRADSQRLVCWALPGMQVIDVTGTSPMVLRELPTHQPSGTYPRMVPFLPESDILMGVDNYTIRTEPYPHPIFEGSYLYNSVSGNLKAMIAPTGYKLPVIEWRYLP